MYTFQLFTIQNHGIRVDILILSPTNRWECRD